MDGLRDNILRSNLRITPIALVSFSLLITTMVGVFSADPNVQLAVMSFISLPLLFASNSLFPTSAMPTWMQDVVRANPLSYASDAARQTLLGASGMTSLMFDFVFLAVFAVVLSALSIMLSLKFLSK